jgi:uncharacterized membrane protein YhaH (DUF805 family)
MLGSYLTLDGRIGRDVFSDHLGVIEITATLISVLTPTGTGLGLLFLLLAFPLAATWVLVVKRLHDLNLSGWHSVWFFAVPVQWLARGILVPGPLEILTLLGLGWLFLAMMFLSWARGTYGPNRFGYPV